MDIQNLKKTNKILLEMGVTTTSSWTNEEEKKFFLTRLFEYSIVNNFSYEFANRLSIPRDLYYQFIMEYNNCLPQESRHTIIKTKEGIDVILKPKTSLNLFYDKLLRLDKFEDIISLFRETKPMLKEVFFRVHRYSFLYSKEDFAKILSKLDAYKKYITEKQAESLKPERNLKIKYNKEEEIKKKEAIAKENEHAKKVKKEKENAIKVVKNFVNRDDYYTRPILKEYGITDTTFKKCVSLVSQENKDLHGKLISKYRKLVTFLNNTIKENNKNFDIIDYLNVTDISPEDLVNAINKNGYLDLRKFHNKYQFIFRDEINFDKEVQNSSIIFNAEFDKNNNYIEGSGREITDEEKQKAIEYIEEHNYYKTQLIYNLIIRKYVKGLITFEEDKKLVKKREQ